MEDNFLLLLHLKSYLLKEYMFPPGQLPPDPILTLCQTKSVSALSQLFKHLQLWPQRDILQVRMRVAL